MESKGCHVKIINNHNFDSQTLSRWIAVWCDTTKEWLDVAGLTYDTDFEKKN